MTGHRLRDRVLAVRARARAAAQRQVLEWVYGSESIYPGDPRRRVVTDDTTATDFRAVQYGVDDGQPIIVGRYTLINHTATFLHGGLHHSDWVSAAHIHKEGSEWVRPPGAIRDGGPIVIGSDVLIAFEALVQSGVTIGHGAIVASRSVVVKDVAPYEIVGGNPARHVKWRFDQPTREALLRIAWWDWPDEKVQRLRREIDSPDVAGFIARHDPLRATG